MPEALTQEKRYTIDGIYSLPEGRGAELIDSQIYYLAPPTRKRQPIAGQLLAAIGECINTKNGS